MPPVVVNLFSTETLLLNVFTVEWAHENIVELEPLIRLVEVKFFLLFDEAVIMTAVCCATVNNHADQFKIVIVLREVEHDFPTLSSLLEIVLSVLAHVKLKGEFKIIVYLDSDHVVKIKFKPLQCHNQILREALDTCPFVSINFAVASFAKVLIVSLQHVSLDEGVKSFKHGLFIFD